MQLVSPGDMAKAPFVVPGADGRRLTLTLTPNPHPTPNPNPDLNPNTNPNHGRRRQLSEQGAAGVEAPDDMGLPDVEAIGTVLWSSPKDVRGVDMGNATLGSPTLAFSLQANGEELKVSGLKTPMSLKLAPFEERNPATTCAGPPSGKASCPYARLRRERPL